MNAVIPSATKPGAPFIAQSYRAMSGGTNPHTRYKSARQTTMACLIAFGVIPSANARLTNPGNSASLANRNAMICFRLNPCAAANSSGPNIC